MPIQTIIEHPAFFGTVLGAVTGWAGSWAAMRLTICQLQMDVRELKERLQRIEERYPMTHEECSRNQERCLSRVCAEISSMKRMITESVERNEEISNALCKLSGVVETWIMVKSKERSHEPL